MTEDLGPAIKALGWSLTAIAILVVGFRFYVRHFIVRRIDWGDWCMLLAMALAIINMSTAHVSINYGIGRHVADLDPSDERNAVKWMYTTQPTAIVSPALSRIAFALLLLSIVTKSQRVFRVTLWTTIVLQLVTNSVMYIVILSQCRPMVRMWDKRVPGICRDLKVQEYFGYFHGGYNSLTDLGLALAPAYILRGLQMKTSLKLGTSVLMRMGIFAFAASTGKTVHLKALGNPTDITWNNGLLRIWALLEQYLVIVAASIPTIRPFFARRSRLRSISSTDSKAAKSRASKVMASNSALASDDGLPAHSVSRISATGQPFERSHERHEGIRKTTEISMGVEMRPL